MNKRYHIELNADDIDPMLDGLRIRTESWSKTADCLESGSNADMAFRCEECSNADEARRIAQRYRQIVVNIEQQVAMQREMAKKAVRFRRPRSGYAIFCPTVFQGVVPACYEEDTPVIFATEVEAQQEIVDNQLLRLQQFLDKERDFDDAITTDEFVQPVKVWPDGSISTEDGRVYGRNGERKTGRPKLLRY